MLMKSLVLVGLSVAILSLGWFVPEGHAAKPNKQQVLALKALQKQQLLDLKALQKQQLLAFKELQKDYVSSLKDLKKSWKTEGLTAKQYSSQVKGMNKQYLADVKAWKIKYLADLKAQTISSKYQVLAFVKNGYKNSVPVPGTLLLFAGGFAGMVYWRARQPVA
jgi:hypothetical protein